MVLIELDGAGAEPVSVAEAKAWCRIERSDEDLLIGALVKAAREAIERETRLILVKRNFRLVFGEVPRDRLLRMPCRPVGPVTAVITYRADGTPASFPVSSVSTLRGTDAPVIEVAEAVASGAENGLELEFTAGFEAPAVPEALKLALKQTVAASYETRAAVPPELQPSLIPVGARHLLAPYREFRL